MNSEDQITEVDAGLFDSWLSFLTGIVGCREDAGVTSSC